MSRLLADMVEWRAIEGFDGYEVCSDGRVRSYFKQEGFGKWKISSSPQREMALSEDGNGYYRTCLRREGKSHSVLVHRLVAEAFLGLCPDNNEVCHKDNDKLNNYVDNLYYGTHKDNAQGGSRLTNEEALLLRVQASRGVNDWSLMDRFEVSREVVRNCRLGNTYKWAGGPLTKRRAGLGRKFESSPTDKEIRQMRVMAHDGVKPLSSIADRFGVSLSYLSKVIRGKFRKEAGGPVSEPRSKHFEERMKIWRKCRGVL